MASSRTHGFLEQEVLLFQGVSRILSKNPSPSPDPERGHGGEVLKQVR